MARSRVFFRGVRKDGEVYMSGMGEITEATKCYIEIRCFPPYDFDTGRDGEYYMIFRKGELQIDGSI